MSDFSFSSFSRGSRKALPIVLGYLPVAFAFGVMAVEAGLGVVDAGLMGLFVFAGSGQLIAVDMLHNGAGSMSIVVTTFVVNLRHLLMSAAVTPYLRTWTKPLQAWYSFEMTDETFAMNISRFASEGVDRDEALGVNCTAHLSWILGGMVGALFGSLIGDIRPYGMDYALAGMFVALLTPHLRFGRRLSTALAAGVIAIVCGLSGAGAWGVIIATALAAAIGVCLPFDDGGDKAGEDACA